MKALLALPFVVALLSACPDSKIPKQPPKIPEPKAAALFSPEAHQDLPWCRTDMYAKKFST